MNSSIARACFVLAVVHVVFGTRGCITIIDDPVTQRQILRTSRGTNRIGLDKTEFHDGPSQRGGLEQGARHGVAAQVVQREVHGIHPRD
jgi:hypothetical protein